MNSVKGIVKLNLRQSKTAYLITAILLTLGITSVIVSLVIPGAGGNESLSVWNYLLILPLLMSIFVPAQNFTKTMNLGGKRRDFFKASVLTYLPVVAACSLAGVIWNLSIDRLLLRRTAFVLSLFDVFGFSRNGMAVAFIQMTAFLLLFCCVLHTLTLIQGHWYGWAADVMIAAIISVFTPIAPLRAALVWFFNMIIFHELAIVQILSCVVLGTAVYLASLIPIRTKQI